MTRPPTYTHSMITTATRNMRGRKRVSWAFLRSAVIPVDWRGDGVFLYILECMSFLFRPVVFCHSRAHGGGGGTFGVEHIHRLFFGFLCLFVCRLPSPTPHDTASRALATYLVQRETSKSAFKFDSIAFQCATQCLLGCLNYFMNDKCQIKGVIYMKKSINK